MNEPSLIYMIRLKIIIVLHKLLMCLLMNTYVIYLRMYARVKAHFYIAIICLLFKWLNSSK